MSSPELFQFRMSHFNEKARWALDWKGVGHVRRSLLPGPHKPTVQRLSGQGQVPVLRSGDEVVAGSSRIIDFLERQHPAPALYPGEPASCARALEVQRWFDDEVGPAVRVAMFSDLFADPRYFASMFTWDRGSLVQLGYRVLFPAVRLVMTKQMGITPEAAARGREITREALDCVAREAGPEGYLVGGRFTVADLTAASLLAPSVDFSDSPFGYPRPYSPALLAWWDRWRGHPGTAYVQRMYERHRGRSSEVA